MELKENTVVVVLGTSGDLAKKKTFPTARAPIEPHPPGWALDDLQQDSFPALLNETMR
jgi:glucose-6-phosphate 1-dehydrogenase